MTMIQKIARKKRAAVIGFALALMLVVSGLFAVQNSSSHVAAAAIVKSVDAPVDRAANAATTVKRDSAVEAVVENRMSEDVNEAARTKALGSGEASYYGPGFAGRPTANGERFNPAEMTAAHRTLPFGSKLRVTNTRNGQSVVVRVNDRGPYAHNRIIDLSQGAAKEIGMIQSGTAHVKLELIS